ncbi:MAG: lactate racemase domain-containing protein [Candidatus Baldrarchaeia archaeon]
MKKVLLPQCAWFGDFEMEISFPDEWEVSVRTMQGHGKSSISEEQIRHALRNPIGTMPLSKLAEGKKDVVIIFDDLTRPTRVYEIVPHIIEELRKAGIKDENIRFICANGAHGTYTRADFTKKLGENFVENFAVFNHNPYANLVYVGDTSYGTPVEINAEVMACDLKIAVGCIVPHPYFGYGGGAKIVLPGVAGMRSICFNHGDLGGYSTAMNHRRVHPSCDMAYGRVNEENILRRDAEEAAKLAGLDFIVNVLVDLRRNSTDIFAGHFIDAQRRGVEVAKDHYRTPILPNADIVISNAYSKGSEAAIAAWPVITLKEGGDMVIIVNSPTGQVPHFVHGRWGLKRRGGDLYLPPLRLLERAGRIILFTQYPEKQPPLEITIPEKTITLKSWDEVLEELKNRHKGRVRVAVYPDATIQKPF